MNIFTYLYCCFFHLKMTPSCKAVNCPGPTSRLRCRCPTACAPTASLSRGEFFQRPRGRGKIVFQIFGGSSAGRKPQ